MTDRAIPAKWRAAVERELKEGESLWWCGRPRPVFFTKMTTAHVLFGIPWTAGVFLWIFSGLEFPDTGNMPYYIGSIFAVVGFGIVLSPMWAYLMALRTVYAITDQRVIIFNRYVPWVLSIGREKVGGSCRTEYRDGTGDVVVKEYKRRASDGVLVKTEHELQRIPEPQRVERIVQSFYRRSSSDETSGSQTNEQFKFDDDISPQLREATARELEAGESIKWAAKPKPKHLSVEARVQLLAGIAIAGLFGAGTVGAVLYSPVFQKASDFWKLFPSLFALAGIAVIFQPLLAHRRILQSVYVITNRRAIIITGGRSITFLSFTPAEFSAVDVEDQLDGTSNLILVKEVSRELDNDAVERHGFMRTGNIDQARAALRSIERAEKASEVPTGEAPWHASKRLADFTAHNES